MLILRARNVFTHPDDTADYVVNILAGETSVFNGFVSHNRRAGAAGLLRTIAAAMEGARVSVPEKEES